MPVVYENASCLRALPYAAPLRSYLEMAPPVETVGGLNTQRPRSLRDDATPAALATGLKSFSTSFPANESPISQGGIWLGGATVGLDWHDVNTNGGHAFGTQPTGSANDDDSFALLDPAFLTFHADQKATGTIFYDGSLSTNTHEVECFLRASCSAHSITGYECNYAFDGSYTEIVVWLGALNSFSIVSHVANPSTGPAQTGDQLIFQIVGDVLTASLKRAGVTTQINTFTDTSTGGHARYASGNPGMGFWHSDSADHYSFSNLALVEL